MGNIRDQLLLGIEQNVEALQHLVEGLSQLSHLVVGIRRHQPFLQVLCGDDMVGGFGKIAQRAQRPARNHRSADGSQQQRQSSTRQQRQPDNL